MASRPALIISDTSWHVRNTHSTTNRMRWHQVAELTKSRTNVARTTCGLEYEFPVSNTIFVGKLPDDAPAYMKCQEGCYTE